MIVTVTLNPSVDYVVKVDELKVGSLNRTNDTAYFAGGKGINVSQVLQELDIKNTATGFVGGFSGKFVVDSLAEKGIQTKFLDVLEPTRINIKLKTGQETEINGAGPAISEEDLSSFLHSLEQYDEGDTLVLAGSIPSSLPSDLYGTLARNASAKGLKVVIDAEKALLEPALTSPLYFIKPNHHELGEYFGVEIDSIEDAIVYGKQLLSYDIENIMISMAGDGAVLLTKDASYRAEVPKGTVINSVGAGDSSVAGFLAGKERGLSIEEAFRLSVATGSATAFSQGLAAADEIDRLIPEVTIHKLK
ncbi:1-phosphofructokinase [Jeotgalibacillus campisalis]|uniref:Tagatose-6-phosphate kinase n=1 Tax=Jeotgalibacillus campisalis TaxID=220754 RepID=A0A0C2VUX7_9BACL|nr:1-phosphofructokinase [Jeotgalibacillus campisalis]KIL52727.1 phosphofructokinase [Jeotgalibacillus campisalis]